MIPALVPSAGLSRRMGRPKLILPVGGETVITRVVESLRRGGADGVFVVVPPADQPGARELAEQVHAAGAEVIACAAPTPDMRSTVEVGLAALGGMEYPIRGLLLAPGDCIGLTPAIVARVLGRFRDGPSRIVVPTHEGRRGHPVALPWSLARSIPDLPPDVGVNALLAVHSASVVAIDAGDAGTLDDLDTPDDLRRWNPG